MRGGCLALRLLDAFYGWDGLRVMATHAGCGAEYVVFLREWFEGKEIQMNAAYTFIPADGDHLVIEAIWKYSVKFEWRGRVFRVRAQWQFLEC